MKKIFYLVIVAFAMLVTDVAHADCTIFYDNSTSQWSQVNIHYWSSPSTTWPGTAMTNVEGNIWKYTFSGNALPQGFLFCNSDGSDQTADASDIQANHLYSGAGGKGAVNDLGEYNVDPGKPYVTAIPGSGERFEDKITVVLSVTPEATIYYTTDGSAVSKSSSIYSSPLTFSETTVLNTLAVTAEGKETAQSFEYTKRNIVPIEGKNLITDYYKVNPDNKAGTRKTINMAFNGERSTTAMSNWTENELIAQGVARDVCMAFRGIHERPVIDSYAIYAAYDDVNLYLGLQLVYTIWDLGGEGKQPGESKPYNMDGALIWAFDLDPETQFDGRIDGQGPIWNQNEKGFKFDNGVDAIWIGSTKPGVGTPGFFTSTPDGHASYSAAYCKSLSGRYYGYADGLLPSIDHIWGQENFGYDPKDLQSNDGFADLTDLIDPSAHTFYEWTFPLSTLGVTADFISKYGIGIMFIDQYGTSPVGGTPYDPSFFDNVFESYSKEPSTSMEKEDDDIITFSPVRIGKVSESGVSEIEADASADTTPVYYNLQGVQVNNPQTGVYIMVKNGKASKVIIH